MAPRCRREVTLCAAFADWACAMLGVSREVCCSAGLCAWPLQHESYLILKSWFCRSSSSGAGGGRQRKTDRSAFPIESDERTPGRSKVSQCELASSFAATVWLDGRAVCYSGNFCAWVSAAQETGTAGEFIGAAVPSLSYLKFLVISNAAALLCLSMS